MCVTPLPPPVQAAKNVSDTSINPRNRYAGCLTRFPRMLQNANTITAKSHSATGP